VVLAVAVLAVTVSLWRYRNRLLLAILLLTVSVGTSALSGQGGLWQQPFLHSMSERILPDSGLRHWFVAHGMPESMSLQVLAGPYSPSTDAAFHQSPWLDAFRHWMDTSGKITFVTFLAEHPWWDVKGTFGSHEELSPDQVSFYGGRFTRPWYPGVLKNLLLYGRQDALLAIWVFVGGTALIGRVRLSWRPCSWTWIGIAALGLLTVTMDWAGDSWELGRHSVDGTLAILLSGVMFLCAASRRTHNRFKADGSMSRRSNLPAGVPTG
jgi:hypothetical protein